MQNILIVEDDMDIQELLREFLKEAGYEVASASDSIEAMELFAKNKYDLILLDIMLPKIDGFGVCELIRKQSQVPIIMLTALGGEEEQIRRLDLQVDDYITKPFKMPILHRRIQAALRKSGENHSELIYNDGYLKIDFEKLTVLKGDMELPMTPTEFKILRLLILNSDKVMTKRLLLEKIWDNTGNFVDEHTVAVNINRLRKKIESEDHVYIKTLYGMGYQWIGRG